MQQLLSQLGINGGLLLSQAVNFVLLLIVLRVFVYKPLLTLLHDRRERIEGGLVKAEEADRRLHEVDEINVGKIKATEAEAMGIIKKTELDAKTLETKLLAEAKRHEEEAVASAAVRLRSQEEESRRAMEKEAAGLVRAAIVKTVELAPDKIDDALIAKAVREAKQTA
jgi:F-type H+-transporting ATPase subunit b